MKLYINILLLIITLYTSVIFINNLSMISEIIFILSAVYTHVFTCVYTCIHYHNNLLYSSYFLSLHFIIFCYQTTNKWLFGYGHCIGKLIFCLKKMYMKNLQFIYNISFSNQPLTFKGLCPRCGLGVMSGFHNHRGFSS